MGIVGSTYSIAKELPNEDLYTIRSQIIRSCISIPSNIAEGSSRNSSKEFKRFLEIALGSCFELETQLLIIKENILKNNSEINSILEDLTEEQRMVQGLIKTLIPN